MTPEISVVICTRNRARVLPRAILAADRQRPPFDFEIVVVDNGSTDETCAVVETLASGRARLRYVYEAEAGLSRARNRGAAESRAPLLAYLDDDAEPVGDWLASIRDAFEASGAAVVGGPILARFEVEPPRWLLGHLSLLSCQDLGPDRRGIEHPPYLFGANLAVRRTLLERLGGFDPSLGRQGSRLFQDEDTDLCERALACGASLVYEPGAAVFHWIPPERMTRAYLRRRAFDTGRSVGFRMRRSAPGPRRALAVAAKAAKLPIHALGWAAATALGQSDAASSRERSMLVTLGILVEARSPGGSPPRPERMLAGGSNGAPP